MEYLSRKEFADTVGVCYNTLGNWLRLGWISPAFVNPSGRMFFTQDQVDAYYRSEYTPKGGDSCGSRED